MKDLYEMSPIVVVGSAFLAGIGLFGIGLVGGGLLIRAIANDRPTAPTEGPGRYAIAAAGPSAFRVLDTATGRVRTCETGASGTPPTCGDWSTN